MASAVQKELVEKNTVYADKFDKADLGIPPAKKFLIGESIHHEIPSTLITKLTSAAHQ